MRAEFKVHAILAGLAAATLLAACRINGFDLPLPAASTAPKPSGTIDTADKVAMSYEMKGKGDPTLVFIHCWSCDRTFWRHQFEDLSRDHRVVWFDLPGHGASGHNRTGWTLDGLGSDVVDLVDNLQLEDMVLIGHSMGGPVALLAARRLPGRVRGIVCVDTLHNAEMTQSKEMMEPIAASFEKDFSGTMNQMVQAMVPAGRDPKIAQEIIRKANATDRTAALALMRDFSNLDLKVALSGAGVPIRCINAAPRPPFAQETNVPGNREYADFDAILMDDVGHYLMLEKPKEFNENLRFILREFSRPAR